MKRRRSPQLYRSSWKKTFEEIEATWCGRKVLVDANVVLEGECYVGCQQTHWSPAEGPTVDFDVKTLTVTGVSDAESWDALALTPELRAFADGVVRAWIEKSKSTIEEELVQEEADRDEAAYDAAVDAQIDAWKERDL